MAGLLAHAPYQVNAVYGRPLLIPLLLVLAGVTIWSRTLGARYSRWGRSAVALTLAGLGLSGLGLIGDYWIGESRSVQLWRLGFLCDILGGSTALVGSTVLGVAPRGAPWWRVGLAGSIPLTAALAFVMNGYVPSFPIAGLCLVWGATFAAGLQELRGSR
ncbi:hypothetical protein [Deinococcus humi]|uniref:Uncharacterized protein n=1 Tax=Deinococcus humi TaxID=662880 RepID=A0A7W8JXG5_9DEIO|nr:hypothetical protein [Deinococcus humi]MBB5364643.1 hypothetical protein [Deinococcus humi]GGO39054.1 hypothetical protein GCM10008949_46590 [Deinococcus humi]